ncbi:RHS repeat-associated core domain-containing protein [Agrobacterium tumefaciens]|nr:RHS repeat-associated core domain-containing protein [Agrobacterium tumefaciens]NTE22927.1 RHS repeat-associated core domain-containing protein [Agrobacterium tumefaciens]
MDSYGKARLNTSCSLTECPFRYQGQYEDAETGLYYNRFRYYAPEEGIYISQDPIGLKGGIKQYGYVKDTLNSIDPLGLSTVYLRNGEVYTGKAKVNAQGRYGNSTTATDVFTDIPNTDIAQGVEQITYERLKEGPYKSKITNRQRPVDMGNKKKIWRREQGEKWLKEKYGDNYIDIIDDKIDEHYKNRGCAK